MRTIFLFALTLVAHVTAHGSRVTVHNNSMSAVRVALSGDQFGTPAGNASFGSAFTVESGRSFDLPLASGAGTVELRQTSAALIGTFPIRENSDGFSHTIIWLLSQSGGTPIYTAYYVNEVPGPPDLDTQIGLFFAGAGFIAPLMVVMLVIRFSRKGALTEYS
jgi:hypothetical protein